MGSERRKWQITRVEARGDEVVVRRLPGDDVLHLEASRRLDQYTRESVSLIIGGDNLLRLSSALAPTGSVVVDRELFQRLLDAANALRAANADGPHPYDLRTDTVLSYGQRTAIAEIIAAAEAFDSLP